MRSAKPWTVALQALVLVALFSLSAQAQTPTPTPTASPDPCPSAHCLNCQSFCGCEMARPGACIGFCAGSAACVNVGGGCACQEPSTPTPTATPTVTATPEPLDHFACYKAGTSKGTIAFAGIANPPGVALVDQFGAATVAVRKSLALCAPTDKLGEDPTAPAHTEHLKGYQIKGPKQALPTNIEVVDQFNPAGMRVDAKKASHLLLPAAKSLSATPPTPAAFETDHFECYKVVASKGAPKFVAVPGVTLQDQFGALTVVVKKPRYLCNPVDKNGEDPTAPGHLAHLVCYQIKPTSLPKFAKRSGVFVNDQLGPETIDVKTPTELCVPALKNP
jgi:hypothetical protein